MRTKLVERYFCEHCNKSMGHRHAMLRHENSCVRNPNRICGICMDGDAIHYDLRAAVNMMKSGCDLLEVRGFLDHCPACILSAILQSGVDVEFHYKEEARNFRRNLHLSKNGRL